MKDSNDLYKKRLARCLIKLMKPVARLLMRNGVGFSDFSEWAKYAFVEVAEQEFCLEKRSQSTSRISILTGMHRKEVARIRKAIQDSSLLDSQIESGGVANRAERVIKAWMREASYTNENGDPKELPLKSASGSALSFERLVADYSGDIHSTTMLDELSRLGAVEIDGDKVKLIERAYIPQPKDLAMLDIAGQAGYDMMSTLSHNLDGELAEDERFLQRAVSYPCIDESAREAFRAFSKKENEKLLQKLNRFLAEHAKTTAENKEHSCQYRAGVGVYYFEENALKESKNSSGD